ncbi:hypothetical protein M0534_11755 [Methylonatrum kenyense]|uniref:hypothetical protein n=1 Tax=Methylonatrum kenyense TaxID=455253 RepID=UPI0020BFC0FB|nr:hypothetical protein [Methylonatrum kenyense]MCK8516993.1 hypothetical protein [Methylonatrum kenyense]
MARDISIAGNQDRCPVIELDPKRVGLIGRRPPDFLKWMPRYEHYGLPWPIRRGFWDRFVLPFADHPTFREVETLLAADLDYERLPSFRAALTQLREKGHAQLPQMRRNRAFSSEPAVRRHYEDVVSLITSIQQHGYLMDEENGIGLGVGHDGRLIKLKHGHHRLAVAQLLGVERVRFRVIAVHPAWMLRSMPAHTVALGDALEQSLSA